MNNYSVSPNNGQEHKVRQVVSDGADIKKKSGFGKFFADFVNGDMKSVKEYLIFEVLLPSVKSTVSDAVSNGVDMLLYGESRSKRYSKSSSGPKVSYNSIYSSDPRNKVSYETRSNASVTDFDGVLVDSRAKAEDILAEMYDVLEEYKMVSVADLYQMAGLIPKIVENEWGWFELSGAQIVRCRDKFLIKMPKPTPLN